MLLPGIYLELSSERDKITLNKSVTMMMLLPIANTLFASDMKIAGIFYEYLYNQRKGNKQEIGST